LKLGFIISKSIGEKRVPLLPQHIKDFENEIYIEKGYGKDLGIEDYEYEKKGCKVLSKEKVFKECDGIFSLKVIKPEDYKYVKEGQVILGWVLPETAGKDFMEKQAIPKKLTIVNLDTINPCAYYQDKIIPVNWIKKNFIRKNSYMAGYSAVLHALMSHGMLPNSNTKVAILGAGNVAQGSFNAISLFNSDIRMFYRKTMNEFLEDIGEYDLIINGIQIKTGDNIIITKKHLEKVKKGCLIIDSAANEDMVIEDIKYTNLENPLYCKDGVYYYCVNNAPSIFYRESSKILSEGFSKYVFSKDIKAFLELRVVGVKREE
jgi:N5-(carboxyethyl)ornithine synthase